MNNIKMENQLKTLFNILKKNDNIYGICLVGSCISEREYSDIDILIIGKNHNKIIEDITKKFKKYNPVLNDDSIRIYKYLNKELSLAIYDYNQLINDIKKYLNGTDIDPQYKNWNIVGWLPECLFYDLKNMIIVYDKDEKIIKIKNMIMIYPQKLKLAIIESCNRKIENLSIRRNKSGKIEQQIIDAELMSLDIRKKFAEKEKYFRGFKNIDRQIEEME